MQLHPNINLKRKLCSSLVLIWKVLILHVFLGSLTKASPVPQCGKPLESGIKGVCPEQVGRDIWESIEPKKSVPFPGPLKYIVVHHSDTPECSDWRSCAKRVRSIQNYHMFQKGWDDIAYNYLIGGDGEVYIGRGRHVQGAHVKYKNNITIGICMIGNFTNKLPNVKALTALRQMIYCLKTDDTIQLRGHRDLGETKCPGNALYNLLKYCPFYNGTSTLAPPTATAPSSTSTLTSTTQTTPSSIPTRKTSQSPKNTAGRIYPHRYVNAVWLGFFLTAHKFVQNTIC